MTFRTASRLVLVALAATLLAGCSALPSTSGPTSATQPTASNKPADVNTSLGIAYMRQGHLDLAYDRLNKALALDPRYSKAHNAMGRLQERLGNLPKAEEHFREAIELNPLDSAAQTNFGSFLCRTDRQAEGEQRFLQALRNSLYERPEAAYTNAGLCTMSAGELDKAEGYFRSALERDPKIPLALIGMAELSEERRRYLPARAYLQRYLEVGVHSARSLWLGVRIERALGDQRSEREYAMRLKTQFPDSRETQQLLESEG